MHFEVIKSVLMFGNSCNAFDFKNSKNYNFLLLGLFKITLHLPDEPSKKLEL